MDIKKVLNNYLILEYNLHELYKLSGEVSLNESSIAEIKGFRPEPFDMLDLDGGSYEEIEEMLYMVYELEYKYHKLINNKFYGVDKRRDNIIKIIELKLKILLNILSETIIETLNVWINRHDVEDVYTWAQERVEMDVYGISDNDYDRLFSAVDFANQKDDNNYYYRWGGPDIYITDLRDIFYEQLDSIRDNIIAADIEEFKEIGLDEYNDDNDTDFKTDEEVIQHIENLELDLDAISDYGYETSVINSIKTDYEATIEAYGVLNFPQWYERYYDVVMEKTSEFKYYINKLNNIKSLSLNDAIVLFNKALNLTHSSGPIMEYYSEIWGISVDYLDELSHMSTTEWDNELKEIGVIINN